MNLIEISNKFPTDLDAIKFFEKKRWGKEISCPYCNDSKHISKRTKDYRFKCYHCDKTFSVTTGTKLHSTNLDLKQWLFAFSLIEDAKKGMSALQLKRNLHISYPTALNMYRKIRELMMIENSEVELDDVVEMDETYVGGKPRKQANIDCLPQKKRTYLDEKIKDLKAEGFKIKKGSRRVACDVGTKRGRGSQKKVPVVGIVEREGNVIAEVMKHLTYENLKQMVNKYVDKNDSVLLTDEYKGYNRFNKIIEHVSVDHKKMFSYKGLNTNTIESFWAILKRQVIGQHHHVSARHLPEYIAETVFKFNNRNKKEGTMFDKLVRNSMLEKD